MDNIRIKEVNGLYKVSDETDGGYVTRMSRYTCNWETIWNQQLELLEFYYNGREESWLLNKKDDFDFHRARRAKARHLKALQIHLGLAEKKKPKETQTILYNEKGWSSSGKIIEAEVVIHDKTIVMRGYSVKKVGLNYTLATDEKIAIAKEFNEKMEEFQAYKKEVFEKLFPDA